MAKIKVKSNKKQFKLVGITIFIFTFLGIYVGYKVYTILFKHVFFNEKLLYYYGVHGYGMGAVFFMFLGLFSGLICGEKLGTKIDEYFEKR